MAHRRRRIRQGLADLAFLVALALPVPAAAQETTQADMLVGECLSREGARERDRNPGPAPGLKQGCIFVFAAPCAEKAGDAHAGMRCYDAEARAWDKVLNMAYGRLRALASPKVFAALQAHQRSWPAFRDTWCGRFHEAAGGASGLSLSAERACLAKETALRAIALQETADNVNPGGLD